MSEVDVYGSKMYYYEQGSGYPILFLHGMPVNSYIWRNIVPVVSELGRAIAVDLIGMGASGKPDIEYSVFDHIKYLTKFIETLDLKNITLVMHGWSSIIGLDYALKHQDNVNSLVFYEPYLKADSHDSLLKQELFNHYAKQPDIENLVTNSNYFVSEIMPRYMMTKLSADDMQHYNAPFSAPKSGAPLWRYLQEEHDDDLESPRNQLIVEQIKSLCATDIPKLLLYSEPGFHTTIGDIMWAKSNLKNLEILDVGFAYHFAQEENPEAMAEMISIWLQGLEQSGLR